MDCFYLYFPITFSEVDVRMFSSGRQSQCLEPGEQWAVSGELAGTCYCSLSTLRAPVVRKMFCCWTQHQSPCSNTLPGSANIDIYSQWEYLAFYWIYKMFRLDLCSIFDVYILVNRTNTTTQGENSIWKWTLTSLQWRETNWERMKFLWKLADRSNLYLEWTISQNVQ